MNAPLRLAALAKAARTSTCLPAGAMPWLFAPLHPRLAFGLDAWVEQLALERAQAAAGPPAVRGHTPNIAPRS
jgi:hypothetical protein